MLRSVLVLAVLVSVAQADDAPKPWSTGVTPERKTAAQEHLARGNDHYVHSKYSDALDEYKQALAEWDHPAIHFNIVKCLMALERPLEASDHLKLALAYGPAPYDNDPGIYADVLTFEKAIAAQIGEIDIACAQDGVNVIIDSRPAFACPGKEHRRVLPGRHTIVGKKPGFVPRIVELVVLGGKQEQRAIALDPLSKVARVEHRWQTWIPWTVFGGGFALAGLGGLLRLKATSDSTAYANMITHDCPNGCMDVTLDHSLDRAAHVENGIAIGLVSVGAAAAVAGTVLLYVNRGYTVYDIPKEPRFDLAPTAGGMAASLSGRF